MKHVAATHRGAAAQATPFPFIIDQAASTISTSDAAGFSAATLRSYGVKQAAAGSIDCTSYLNGIPGGPWYNASGLKMVASSIKAVQELIATGNNAGLDVYLSSDLFQMPVGLLDKYMDNFTSPGMNCIGYKRAPKCISIRSAFTQQVYRVLFDELLATFPGIKGLVLRYGENSPCTDHLGNAPFDSTNDVTAIASLTELLLFLREELAVKRNLTVIMRTWDTNASMFHANATFYNAVTAPVPPHPRLIFSIKHGMLDFWRRVRFNPTLGVGNHSQVVEAEVGGMYGGCGTWPLYVGNGIIDTFSEYAQINEPYGLTWLRAAHPDTFVGVLTNHQCTHTPAAAPPFLWWRLEQAAIAGWAANPDASEAQIFDAHVQAEWGITDAAARAALRNLTLTAMDANLALQTCNASDSQWPQNDRPTSNWLLWDGIGGLEQLANNTCHAANATHCETFPWLYNNSALDVAVAEKDGAAATYEALNATAHADIIPSIPNATVALSFAASMEAGVRISRLIAAGWRVMALGYAGDRAGGHYNVPALRAAVAAYDAARSAYYGFPASYPPGIAPGLMNDTYWEHPTSGQGGLLASVDKYRGI